MDEIRWEDPPPQRAGPGSHWWAEQLEPLREHPKRWAILTILPTARRASTVASNFRSGHARIPPGRWEFISRTVDGEHRVTRPLRPEEVTG